LPCCDLTIRRGSRPFHAGVSSRQASFGGEAPELMPRGVTSVGALFHLGYPFRCRNGRFIIEGPVSVRSAEAKRHIAPICDPASRHDHRSAKCRRSYLDGRSAICRRRLTTKSYLSIALPMPLGIKHASALEEAFKQSNEKQRKERAEECSSQRKWKHFTQRIFIPRKNLPFLKLQAGVCI
jgi:hypothetical protein